MINHRVLFLGLVVLWSSHGVYAATTLACPTRNHPGVPNNPPCQPGFPVALTELGNDSVGASSANLVDLDGDGAPEIIFGTTGGRVVAVKGNGTLLWAYKTGIVPIHSKPVVADLDGDGLLEVVVGAGSPETTGGGVYVLSSTGQLKCAFTSLNPEHPQGVFSSPAVGRLDTSNPTKMQIVFGSFDFRLRALRHDCSVWWQLGVPEYVVDTIWSSPTLVDLDQDGKLDVVIGTDSNLHVLPGLTLPDGGMVRALRGDGSGDLPGFPLLLNEVVYSSPAVGDITGNGQLDIAVGTGRCWDMASCAANPHAVTKATFAWNSIGSLLSGWPAMMPGQSSRTASPALAKFSGVAGLVTIINTMRADDVSGVLHAIRSNGTELPGWPREPSIPASCTPGDVRHDGTQASPVVANLSGDLDPEIILPSVNEFVIWDRNGNQLTTKNGCPAETGKFSLFSGSGAYFSSAAVGDLDKNGRLEVIGTGTHYSVPGYVEGSPYVTVYAWTFSESLADPRYMDWPMFRRDSMNSGVYRPNTIFSNGFE